MNKPKIRFKGFEGEWKRQSLGDISASFSGGTPAVSVSDYYGGNIPFIRSGEIHENRTQLYITQAGLNNSSAKIVEKGTILYALYGATSGDVGFSKLRGAINQAILAIEPTKKYIDRIFLVGFLQSYKHRIINELLQGGQGNLSGSLVKKILLAFPSLPEQRALASYFTSLDAQIVASTSRLSSLKQIKAASLLNMFPQKGETVPRVRFKGFQGEWKKVKIGDVAPLTGGFAFQSGQFKTSGVPIIRISNILSSGIVGGDFVYYNEFKGDSEFRLYKGDVVIAMSGATTGKVATFEANDFGYQNQRVGKFSRTNLVNYELLSKLVSAPNFQKKIISKLTSSAQPNASSKDIDSIDLVVPEETEEQRAIASYFTALDAQITLHRERLEKLKQIKAACLEKMFA